MLFRQPADVLTRTTREGFHASTSLKYFSQNMQVFKIMFCTNPSKLEEYMENSQVFANWTLIFLKMSLKFAIKRAKNATVIKPV